MNPTPISTRQNAKDAMARLTQLERRVTDVEQTLSKVLMAVNQVLGQLSKNLDETAEQVEALVSILGPEEVAQAIAELRATKLRQNAEKTKADIAKAVTENRLKPVEAVDSDNVLIVGKEVQKDGNEIPPGYAAVRFLQLKPDYKTKFFGKKAGDVVETENGGSFTIQELYDVVAPPPAPAEGAAPAAPAPEAPAAAEPAPAEAVAEKPAEAPVTSSPATA